MFVNLLIINNYMQVMEIRHTNTASYLASYGKKWKPMDRGQKKSVPSARLFNNTMKVLLFHHLHHRTVARPQEIDAVRVTGEVDLNDL